jgi:hypothetical protein
MDLLKQVPLPPQIRQLVRPVKVGSKARFEQKFDKATFRRFEVQTVVDKLFPIGIPYPNFASQTTSTADPCS